MTDQPLYLHAGAHRTGTSSFQLCLDRNRDWLEEQGYAVGYTSRDGLSRGDLALRLPAPRHLGQPLEPWIERARTMLDGIAGDRPLIVSEENLIGPMRPFMNGRFYPRAEPRIKVLRKAWSGRFAHVLFVIRPYAALYMSQYRKRAEDNYVDPFDEVRKHYLSMDRGWPEIIAAFRDLLRPEALTVLHYHKRGSSIALLSRLVPDLPAGLVEPEDRVNQSATDAALLHLQERYAKGEKLNRAEWQTVIANYAEDTASRGYARFDEVETTQLDARYDQDVEQIGKMDGVTLI